MNKHILMLVDHQLNPAKYTKEQLKQNAADARAARAAADVATRAAARAVRDRVNVNAADYWLSEYFVNTGENKQDYIDAINKGNKQ